MASVEQKHKSAKFCVMCGKKDQSGFSRPHSLHRTKRTVKPNFQTKWGFMFCQNCFRTLKKHGFNVADISKKKVVAPAS